MINDFQRAEHLLYTFPVNLMRIHEAAYSLRRLKAETDCHAQSYGASHASTGSHSDPVVSYATRISNLEQLIRTLKQKTSPVQRVRELIQGSDDERDKEMFCVMELYYFERRRLEEVAFHLQKSASTLSRRRQELAGLVMYEMQCNDMV